MFRKVSLLTACTLAVLTFAVAALAADPLTGSDAALDPIMGEFAGTLTLDGAAVKAEAKVHRRRGPQVPHRPARSRRRRQGEAHRDQRHGQGRDRRRDRRLDGQRHERVAPTRLEEGRQGRHAARRAEEPHAGPEAARGGHRPLAVRGRQADEAGPLEQQAMELPGRRQHPDPLGRHEDEPGIRQLQVARGVPRALHAGRAGAGPGQQRRLSAWPLRDPGARFLRPDREPGRMRRDLRPEAGQRQRLAAAGPVADLRHRLHRPAVRRLRQAGQGRDHHRAAQRREGPRRRRGDEGHRRGLGRAGEDRAGPPPGPRQSDAVPQHLDRARRPVGPGGDFRACRRGEGAAKIAPVAEVRVNPDVLKRITAALPEKAPAVPSKPRKLLVFTRAKGYVHGSIPVATKTFELLGKKTGAFEVVASDDLSAGGRQSQAVRRRDDEQHDGRGLWPAASQPRPDGLARTGQGPGPAEEPAGLRGRRQGDLRGSCRDRLGRLGRLRHADGSPVRPTSLSEHRLQERGPGQPINAAFGGKGFRSPTRFTSSRTNSTARTSTSC